MTFSCHLNRATTTPRAAAAHACPKQTPTRPVACPDRSCQKGGGWEGLKMGEHNGPELGGTVLQKCVRK